MQEAKITNQKFKGAKSPFYIFLHTFYRQWDVVFGPRCLLCHSVVAIFKYPLIELRNVCHDDIGGRQGFLPVRKWFMMILQVGKGLKRVGVCVTSIKITESWELMQSSSVSIPQFLSVLLEVDMPFIISLTMLLC